MSFMKKLKGLADDFKELLDDKDKPKEQHKPETKPDTSHDQTTTRGAADSFYQSQPGQNAPQQSYPTQQHNYSGPPGQQSYPPPQQGSGQPPSGPHLPPGWTQQWDQNSQRYYYLEQATGRSQWEPPHMPPQGPPSDQARAFGGPPGPGQGYPAYGQQGYNQYNQGYSQQSGYPPPVGAAHPGGQNYPVEAVKSGEKKKSNKGGMLAAGAGGLLVGGIAGAALADDSDDEHRAAPAAGYGTQPQPGYGYGQDPSYGYGGPPPMSDAQALEHNPNVSSSQRSSLEEARHDYEEAQREAADSDASSSDREEAAEAREEYQEEIEEAQEEAYDD